MRVGWVWSNDTGGGGGNGIATFADSPEGIVRTSGIAPASGDYTWCGWVSFTGTPSAATFRTFFRVGDDPSIYVDYIWIGQVSNGRILMDVSGVNNSGPIIPDGEHFLAYIRSGTTHTLYLDGSPVVVVTVDVSAATFTHQYLGTDTDPTFWDPSRAAYSLEWDVAKTAAGIQAQRLSATVLDVTNLWANTPLIDDLLDISGNGRDWADSGGTVTFTLPIPPMPSKFYVQRGASPLGLGDWDAGFLPETWRGGYDSFPLLSAGNFTFNVMDPIKDGGASSSLSRAETNVANPFRVGICRFLTRQLATQTIEGMFDVILATSESNIAADFYWKVYVYVTVGETDVVRGVCLDFEDDFLEWPTTVTGIGLPASQPLTPTVAFAGDRLVVELGYISRNAVTTSRTGLIRLGAMTAAAGLTGLADLTIGSTVVTTTVGSILFSDPPDLISPPANNTFAAATVLTVAMSETIDINGATRDGDEPETCLGEASVLNAVGRWSSVWYTWTAPSDQYVRVRSEITNAPVEFDGALLILTGTPGSFVTIDCAGSNAVDDITFFATMGVVYTFMVGTRVYWGGTLTFTFTPDVAAPTDPIRTILVPSDLGGASRSVTLDGTTGEVIEVFDFVSGEPGDRVASAIFAIGKNNGGVTDITAVNVYLPDRTLIASVTGIDHPTGWDRLSPVRSNNNDLFYVAPNGSGVTTLQTVDLAGNIGVTTWALPQNSIHAMVPALDDSLLYYASGNGTTIYRYDLVASTAIADLLAAGSVFRWGREALIVPEGLLVMAQLTGNFDDNNFAVRLLDIGTGATIRTYMLGNAAGSDPILSRDPDQAYFWTYTHPVIDYVDFLPAPSVFTRWRVSDGAVDVTFTVLTEEIGGLVPLSCPFYVFGPAGPIVCPGILGAPRIGV